MDGKQTIYKCTFLAICQSKIRTSQGLYDKDKDQIHKDLKLVLKESLRARINITGWSLLESRNITSCNSKDGVGVRIDVLVFELL